MQTIPQIDDPQDIQKAYISMVQIYGKDIFGEPRRALGCLADMAPRLDREYENLSVVLKAGIPAILQSAGKSEKELKEKGMQAVQVLRQSGLGEEEALVMVENLGAALQLKFSIRPDYSKGGEIPYEPEESHNIRDAIDAMNHIRWFLNHEKDYQWNSGKKELTELRRMMSYPGKYRAQIEETYKKLVHRFGNNPYEEYILLEGDEKQADFSSGLFEDYFITIGDMPVPMGFAREYPDHEIEAACNSWDKKKQSFLGKVKNLSDRISNIKPSGDAQTAKALVSAGRKFILWSLIFVGAFVYIVKDMAMEVDFIPLIEFAKASKFDFPGMFEMLKNMDYGGNYYLYSGLALLGILIGGLLILSAVGTIFRCAGLKGAGGTQPKKIAKAMDVLRNDIPSELASMEKSMKEYLNKAQNKVSFSKKDYRSVLKDAQTAAAPVKVRKTVSKTGRHLRRLLFVLAVVNLYNIQNGAVSDCREGCLEVSRYLTGSGDKGYTLIGKAVNGEFALSEVQDVDLSQYKKVTVADATQSSYINSSGGNNYTVWEALDGNQDTSWQEGVQGNGVEEFILMTFDKEYTLEYLTLKLGKWRNTGYEENNRPSRLLFRTGGQEFLYDFPDEQREFVLRLNNPVKASDLMIIIQGVYQGSKWDDTCITDVGIYGSDVKKKESKEKADFAKASEKKEASEKKKTKEKTWKGRVSRGDQDKYISAGETLVQDTMVQYLLANKASRAAYVLDAGKRQEYGIENSDNPMPASALIAVPIMFTVASEAEKGNLSLDEMAVFHYTFSGRGNLKKDSDGREYTVMYLLEQALQFSDNNAINALVDHLGLDRINQVCHDYGFTSVDMQRKIDSGNSGKENYISAKDAAMMLNAVYQNNFGEINRDFLKNNFHIYSGDSANGGMYSAGKNYPVFLNLNGVTETRYNEVGLFEDGDTVFIVSVLTVDGRYTDSMDMVSKLTGYIASAL